VLFFQFFDPWLTHESVANVAKFISDKHFFWNDIEKKLGFF